MSLKREYSRAFLSPLPPSSRSEAKVHVSRSTVIIILSKLYPYDEILYYYTSRNYIRRHCAAQEQFIRRFSSSMHKNATQARTRGGMGDRGRWPVSLPMFPLGHVKRTKRWRACFSTAPDASALPQGPVIKTRTSQHSTMKAPLPSLFFFVFRQKVPACPQYPTRRQLVNSSQSSSIRKTKEIESGKLVVFAKNRPFGTKRVGF